MPITEKVSKTESQRRVDFLSWIADGKAEELGLKLFDEVAELYELQLAKMEFTSLGSEPRDSLFRSSLDYRDRYRTSDSGVV